MEESCDFSRRTETRGRKTEDYFTGRIWEGHPASDESKQTKNLTRLNKNIYTSIAESNSHNIRAPRRDRNTHTMQQENGAKQRGWGEPCVESTQTQGRAAGSFHGPEITLPADRDSAPNMTISISKMTAMRTDVTCMIQA